MHMQSNVVGSSTVASFITGYDKTGKASCFVSSAGGLIPIMVSAY